MSFSLSGEHVNFDMKGDSIPSYDLINWQRFPDGDINFINVGMYDGSMDAGKELVIEDKKIKWPGNQSKARCSHNKHCMITQTQFSFSRLFEKKKIIFFCSVIADWLIYITFKSLLFAAFFFFCIFNIV